MCFYIFKYVKYIDISVAKKNPGSSYAKYIDIFGWKNVSSFCIAKATHIFCNKNINVFENTLATIIDKFVINELVKLSMLWTIGP